MTKLGLFKMGHIAQFCTKLAAAVLFHVKISKICNVTLFQFLKWLSKLLKVSNFENSTIYVIDLLLIWVHGQVIGMGKWVIQYSWPNFYLTYLGSLKSPTQFHVNSNIRKLRTCVSLSDVGLSQGFFWRQASTKCLKTSLHSGALSIGLSFWAMWYKALIAFILK